MKLILSFLALSAVCAFTSAGIIQPLSTTVELEENSPPNYEFQYSVHDSHTGDIKDQFEHRRGDYVTGRYSLVEPDGNRRIVDYSSDPLLGFSAQVHRDSPSTLLAEHVAVAADDAVVATEVVEDSETPAATYRL